MSKARETIEQLRDALIWCSGSDDFNDGGKASEGWLKLCAPILEESGVGLLNGTYNDTPSVSSTLISRWQEAADLVALTGLKPGMVGYVEALGMALEQIDCGGVVYNLEHPENVAGFGTYGTGNQGLCGGMRMTTNALNVTSGNARTNPRVPRKGVVTKVGTFTCSGEPIGWEFDCRNGAVGISLSPGEGEPILYAGHTLAELKEIVSSKSVLAVDGSSVVSRNSPSITLPPLPEEATRWDVYGTGQGIRGSVGAWHRVPNEQDAIKVPIDDHIGNLPNLGSMEQVREDIEARFVADCARCGGKLSADRMSVCESCEPDSV